MVAIVPILITTGKITNHISMTVFNPDLKKSITPGALIPTSVAVSKPCLNAVFPSGNASVRALSGTSLAYSSGILFKGQILGIMTAATRQDTITDK